jgi:hypothetical protein
MKALLWNPLKRWNYTVYDEQTFCLKAATSGKQYTSFFNFTINEICALLLSSAAQTGSAMQSLEDETYRLSRNVGN